MPRAKAFLGWFALAPLGLEARDRFRFGVWGFGLGCMLHEHLITGPVWGLAMT